MLGDSAPASQLSSVFLMMLTISSERMAIPSPFGRGGPGIGPNLGANLPRLGRSLDQPTTQPLEAATDAGVDQSIADLDSEPSDEPRINARGKFHLGAGELFHANLYGRELALGEWLRRGYRGGDDAARLSDLGIVFGTHGGQDSEAAPFRQEQGQVQSLRRDVLAQQLLHDLAPLAEGHGRAVYCPGDPLIAGHLSGQGKVALPRIDLIVADGQLKSRLRVTPSGADA